MEFDTFIRLDFETKIIFLKKIGKLTSTSKTKNTETHTYYLTNFFCELTIVDSYPKEIYCYKQK